MDEALHVLDDISQDDSGGWWWACRCDASNGQFDDRDDALIGFGIHCGEAAALSS